MKIDVSVVTFHTPDFELQRVLESVQQPLVRKVYVVDNGSEQRIRDVARKFPNVEYLKNENQGYGAGHNRALRKSLEEGNVKYCLVLNTDVSFSAESLSRMACFVEKHPEIAVAHPRILGLDGTPQSTARLLPSPFDLLLRRFLPKWFCAKRRSRYLMKDGLGTEVMEVGFVQGSFMLIRCEALRKTGLFDEQFFMYAEDVDLCRRLLKVGNVVRYGDAEAVHEHRAESYRWGRMLVVHIKSMILYFNKWGWFADKDRQTINKKLLEKSKLCKNRQSSN